MNKSETKTDKSSLKVLRVGILIAIFSWFYDAAVDVFIFS